MPTDNVTNVPFINNLSAKLHNLYIYKIGAKKVITFQTPATVLVLEGWNFDTDPTQYSRLYIVKIFGIGQRVPKLGPNFGQILKKIAISREPLVRFGWNFDCKVIFDLQGYLKGNIKALKPTVFNLEVAQKT